MSTVSARIMQSSGVFSAAHPGQVVATTSTTFIVKNTKSISVLCVCAGTRQRGGSLSYTNNIAVTPGETLTITISSSSNGATASLSRGGVVLVAAINGLAASGVGAVKFSGGESKRGGAAGYAGDGGSNSGGSGGNGGFGGSPLTPDPIAPVGDGGGGGVGLLGIGASGANGRNAGGYASAAGGKGGSGGTDGITVEVGGNYGGAPNGAGAVRIIWPGDQRKYPSTRTGDE